MSHWLKKHLRISVGGTGTFIIIGVAVLLRVLLIAQGWPGMSSDEGTMGLEALHIAYRGELPIFYYGQNYMGTIEAYLGAGAYHLFGVSSFSLRLGMVFLFALFLLVVYLLARMLYTKNIALFSIALLCFGSTEIYTRQLRAIGGYPETMLFGALMLLLASWLALSFHPDAGATERKKRFVAYGCLGLVIGLAIWSDMLVLPFVPMTLLLLFIFCRSELRTRTILWLLLGLLIGALPLLIYNVLNPAQNSFGALLQLHNTGGTAASLPYTFWDQMLGTVLLSVPQATGASPLCPISTQAGQWEQQMSSCMLFQGAWGVAFLILLIVATVVAIRALPGWRTTFNPPASLAFDERKKLVRHTARLLLLGAAILTLLAYILSPAPALVPVTSSRYLVTLLVATPALLWPLFSALYIDRPARISFSNIAPILKLSVLLFVFIVFVGGTISVFQQIPSVESISQKQYALIDELSRIHAVHIYSDYGTCNRLIFQSNESIICSVLDNNLHTGQNRYPPYETIVQNDANATYVFPSGSPQDNAFAQTMATSSKYYQRFSFEGYVIYQPESVKPQVSANDSP